MNTDSANLYNFARLEDVATRQAWVDEAKDFTPWLAQILSHLSESLGLELELVEAEASLPTKDDGFSADILARNPIDDSNVLIENQLEPSDHRHLGQILTYLAGLEARTIIWVAPHFREAHLAAIRWLNANTAEDFSFFAVKIRVVQIADSPFAPLFDVVEKPNTWERQLQAMVRSAKNLGGVGTSRKTFWEFFFEHYPHNQKDGQAGGHSAQWRRCEDDLIVSYFLSKKNVGVFVRGDGGVPAAEVQDKLMPFHDELENALHVPFGPKANNYFLMSKFECDYTDPDQYAEIAQWLDQTVNLYEKTLNALFND